MTQPMGGREVARLSANIYPRLAPGFGNQLRRQMTGVGSTISSGLTKPVAAFATATGKMGAGLRKAGTHLRSTGASMTLFSAGLALAGKKIYSMARDYEQNLNRMRFQTGVAEKQVQQFSRVMLTEGPKWSKSPQELASAMYFITSSGLKGADALEVLEAAAKGSALGLGTTEELANLATSAMNAYGKENLSAANATDYLMVAIREGKLETDELINSMGRVIPVSSNMGVEFQEVAAAMAGMSLTGTDAFESATQLRQILFSLLKPTPQAKEQLKELGLSAKGLREQLREEGLLATLKTLTGRFGDNDEAIGKVFGNVRALTGVMNLMGANTAQTEKIFKKMAGAAGLTEEQYAKWAQTTEGKTVIAQAKMQASMTELGQHLLPIVAEVMGGLAGVVRVLAEQFAKMPKVLQKGIVIGLVALVALGPGLYLLGVLSTGLGVAFQILSKAAVGLGNALKFLWANPIVAVIVALALAAVFAYTKFEGFRKVVHASLSKIGEVAMWVFNHILRPAFDWIANTAIPAVGAAAMWLWRNALVPAFKAIGAVASWVWNHVIKPAFSWIINTGAPALGAAFMWLWTNVLGPVFRAIGKVAEWVFNTILVPAWQNLVYLWKTFIAPIALWLWNSVLQPVFKGIGAVVSWLWNTIIRPYFMFWFNLFRNVIAPALLWFWHNVAEPAFRAIGTAALWLWNNAIKPAFTFIGAIISFVWRNIVEPVIKFWVNSFRLFIGPAILWLWHNIVAPAFKAMGAVIGFIWGKVIAPALKAFWFVISKIVAPIIMWLWKTVIAVAFAAIGAVIKFIWNVIIRPVFNAIRGFIVNILAPVIRWLWNNVIKPVWNFIARIIRWVWNHVIKPAWAAIRAYILNVLGPIFRWLWNNVIKPVWNFIKTAIQKAWHFIRDKVFKPLANFVTKQLPRAFQIARDAIGRVWSGIQNLVKKPIIFVLETVYEKGIRAAWEKIRGVISGLPALPSAAGIIGNLKRTHTPSTTSSLTASQKALFRARGGPVKGPGTRTSDSIPAMLSRDEWVIKAQSARRLGDRNMAMINDGYLPVFGLATGGSISEIIRFAKKSGARVSPTSTYRPGDPGWHGKRRAVDFGGFNQHKLAQHFMGVGGNLLELIHTTNGRFYGVKNGQAVGRGFYGGQVPLHRNHVHVAANPGFSGKKGGGLLGFIRGGIVKAFKALWKGVASPILSKITKHAPFKNVTRPLGQWVLDSVRDALVKKAQSQEATSGGLVAASGSVMRQALAQARAMGASKKVLLALFEAGFVESGFRNLNYGDRDSIGFLQQRPSQGWGTRAQIMNVPYATRSFVSRAMRIQGRYSTAGALAQAVQRSAFPGRYHSMRSRAIAALRSLGVKMDNGGMIPPGLSLISNELNEPERIISPRQWDDMGPSTVNVNVKVYMDGREITDRVEVMLDQHDRELALVLNSA